MENIAAWLGLVLGSISIIGVFIKIGETKRDISKHNQDIEEIKKEVKRFNDFNLRVQKLEDYTSKGFEIRDERMTSCFQRVHDGYESIMKRMDRKDEEDRVARIEAEGGRDRAMATHQEVSEMLKIQVALTQQALESKGIIPKQSK